MDGPSDNIIQETKGYPFIFYYQRKYMHTLNPQIRGIVKVKTLLAFDYWRLLMNERKIQIEIVITCEQFVAEAGQLLDFGHWLTTTDEK